MKYCSKCIIPNTRPGIVIEEDGACNACHEAEKSRAEIDWGKRAAAWHELVQWAKETKARYDCVIPVSGGKDSTWQTVKCLESGLHPLAVTWKTPGRTELGQKNLDNLIALGVDHIDFSVNPAVERRFMLATFKKAGSPAIPMHLAIFNIPSVIAVCYDIPLIVWGENSAVEYGGTDEALKGEELTAAWLKQYGVSQGTVARDWLSPELSLQDLSPYRGLTVSELAAHHTRAVFLGHFFAWDPDTSRTVAEQYGFTTRQAGPKTGYYNYADIDDDFISIHHFLKWYMFGMTRLFDNLSLEIRRGRLTREEAIKIVQQSGDQIPHEDIAAFCRYVGISEKDFFKICEQFRNKAIWVKKGTYWRMPDFLIPDWPWI